MFVWKANHISWFGECISRVLLLLTFHYISSLVTGLFLSYVQIIKLMLDPQCVVHNPVEFMSMSSSVDTDQVMDMRIHAYTACDLL